MTVPPAPWYPPDDDVDGPVGGELVLRPDDELDTWRPGIVDVWRPPRQHLIVRVRQAANRTAVLVIDQPAVTRVVAVSRQLPRVVARLAKYAPRGAYRLAGDVGNLLFATRSARLIARQADADHPEWAKNAETHAKLHDRLSTRRWGFGVVVVLVGMWCLAVWAPLVFSGLLAGLVFVVVVLAARTVCHNPKELGGALLAAAVLAGLAWWQGPALAGLVPRLVLPWWAWTIVVLALVGVCGWKGRRDDQPLVDMPPRSAPHELLPVTAPMVIGALINLGKSQMKDPETVRVLLDPHKVGDGVQLDLELPGSVTAAEIIDDREPLAAAMRHPLGCVWPSVGPRHPGHLMMFVSRVPMSAAVQAAWPLEHGPRVSLFDPLPLFTDQRGQWVKQTLAYTSWVIGAVPRMGKTRALLNLGLTAALDVRARLFVFDLKGTGDMSALAKVAHYYDSGDEPEQIESHLHTLRRLRQEMRKRAQAVRELTLEENPDKGKVTDALASKDPARFGPIVILADEVQVWTQEFSEALPGQVYEGRGKRPKDEGKETRDEFIKILRDLVKRGPALGIITVLATQKPDAKSIPSSIADNASARLCFKVNGQISNDQILGTSSYQAGIRATQFAFSEKGIAYFRGDGAEPLVVRTVDMDATRAEEIASRARALRLAEGLLSGDADDVDDLVLVTDIVDDVEQVMRERGRGTAHHQELVEWLRELRQEDYEELTVDEVSARLRARGVRISQLRIGGVNRKGVRISDLRKRGDGDAGPDSRNADA